jgi:hypothetical protein
MSKMISDEHVLETKHAGTMVSDQDPPAKDDEGWTTATSTRKTRSRAKGKNIAPKVTKKSKQKRSATSNDKLKSVKKQAASSSTSSFASPPVNTSPASLASDHKSVRSDETSSSSGRRVNSLPTFLTDSTWPKVSPPNYCRNYFARAPFADSEPTPRRGAAGKFSAELKNLKVQISQLQLAMNEQTAVMTKMMAAFKASSAAPAPAISAPIVMGVAGATSNSAESLSNSDNTPDGSPLKASDESDGSDPHTPTTAANSSDKKTTYASLLSKLMVHSDADSVSTSTTRRTAKPATKPQAGNDPPDGSDESSDGTDVSDNSPNGGSDDPDDPDDPAESDQDTPPHKPPAPPPKPPEPVAQPSKEHFPTVQELQRIPLVTLHVPGSLCIVISTSQFCYNVAGLNHATEKLEEYRKMCSYIYQFDLGRGPVLKNCVTGRKLKLSALRQFWSDLLQTCAKRKPEMSSSIWCWFQTTFIYANRNIFHRVFSIASRPCRSRWLMCPRRIPNSEWCSVVTNA